MKITEWKNSKIEIVCNGGSFYFPATGEKSFFAIPYSCKDIAILNVIRKGKVIFRKFIKIRKKSYPVSRITVRERKKTKKVLKRIEKEHKKLRSILTTVSP
ncbi:MAG: hypothetical protein Q9M89_03740 [Persephonella sp.]|nr:hypothetical protein [Persephonella sp.]